MFGFLRYRIFCLVVLSFWAVSASAVGTISIAPTLEDVGTIGVGVLSPNEAHFNITNTAGGNNPLTISNVTSSNSADFVITQPVGMQLPVVIPAGESYLIVVEFTPNAAGVRTSDITAFSDDANGNTALAVTAQGYGGIEQSIEFFPKDIEAEIGHGVTLRAEIVFDNGATGPAQLNWQSSNPSVATVTDAGIDESYANVVSTGEVDSSSLGSANISATGVNNPSVSASTSITIVPTSVFEFVGASAEDRVTKITGDNFTLCYDFPEVDTFNDPLYGVNQVGARTVNIGEIGDIYVSAVSSASTSEEVFFIPNDCSGRTTVFDITQQIALFTDMVVDSQGRAIVGNLSFSNLWRLEPGIPPLELVATGLPVNDLGELADIGAMAIDSADNVYTASLVETSAERRAAVYVRPNGIEQWFPIATIFNSFGDSSFTLPGIAAIQLDNQGYAMKLTSWWDKSEIEKYTDLDQDGNFYEIVGTAFIPDPGEIATVAHITAGADVNVDPDRNLIVSTGQKGRDVIRMQDLNDDNDFDDAREQRMIYQSNAFTNLVDVAFATPCGDQPPIAKIEYLPPDGIVEFDETIFILGGGSSDPCDDPLTYSWDIGNDGSVEGTNATIPATFSGPIPGLYDVALTVTDPFGNSASTVDQVKVGRPVVDGFWPSNGVQGDVIIIFGKNFQNLATPFAPEVSLNGVDAPFTQLKTNELMFVLLPAGDLAGPVVVTTLVDSATGPVDFGLDPPVGQVVVNGVWPSSAAAGDLVLVFGSGFCTVPGCLSLTINGTDIPFVQTKSTDLFIFIMASGVTSGPLCVTSGGSTGCWAKDFIALP